ncbi:LCP family protein [Chloroflexota bacterium]
MVNLLLIGVDSARNLNAQNTDVIIIVSVNKDTKQVSMLSIPRDLWVYIPTYGWTRINQAHKYGYRHDYPGQGTGLLSRTIEMNFGIPIHHWARVDFQGFTRVVDALGGVEMTVACPVNLRYMAPTSPDQEEMPLEPGVYHMDGALALRYVRTRRHGSDFDRARRQQQFLRAVWDQTKNQFKDIDDLIPKIQGLWSALRDSYETDMDLLDLVPLVPVALEINPQRVSSFYIGPRETTDWTTAEGARVLLPNYEKIQRIVARLYAPPSGSEDLAAAEAARIQVRNGTYRHQLAKIGADQLRWQGLNIVDTALADRPDYKHTQIVVFNEKPITLELLAQLLNVKPENILFQPDPNQSADLLVILGEDYDPCR